MAVDFPIGTRLTVCGKTLEVVADKGHLSCHDCAVKRPGMPEVLLGKEGALGDHLLDSYTCRSLECIGGFREDGTSVHWQLNDEH